jgi:hypothetical protein
VPTPIGNLKPGGTPVDRPPLPPTSGGHGAPKHNRAWVWVLVVAVICALVFIGKSHNTPAPGAATTTPAPVASTTGVGSASQDALAVRTFNVSFAKWVTQNVIAQERQGLRVVNLALYQEFIHLSGAAGPQVRFAGAGVALFSFNSGPNVCATIPRAARPRLAIVACPKGS